MRHIGCTSLPGKSKSWSLQPLGPWDSHYAAVIEPNRPVSWSKVKILMTSLTWILLDWVSRSSNRNMRMESMRTLSFNFGYWICLHSNEGKTTLVLLVSIKGSAPVGHHNRCLQCQFLKLATLQISLRKQPCQEALCCAVPQVRSLRHHGMFLIYSIWIIWVCHLNLEQVCLPLSVLMGLSDSHRHCAGRSLHTSSVFSSILHVTVWIHSLQPSLSPPRKKLQTQDWSPTSFPVSVTSGSLPASYSPLLSSALLGLHFSISEHMTSLTWDSSSISFLS